MLKIYLGNVLFVLIMMTVFVTGCTKSISVNYSTGIDTNGLSLSPSKIIGIAKFKDERSWSKSGDAKAQSWIAQQPPWKFGLTYKSKEYIPINDLVQELFIEEFRGAGFKVRELDKIVTESDTKRMQEISILENLDYVMGGKILSFEFVNAPGFFTVNSTRSVTIVISLVRSDGNELIANSVFNEIDAENEGMGILHSTNVDILMNRVFKKVVQNVARKVSLKLALNPENINIRFALGGSFFDFKFGHDFSITQIDIINKSA